MKLVVAIATGLSIATVTIGTMEAQEQKKRERQRFDAAFFERLDTNKDGIVTMDEIPAERQESAKKIFDRLDSDRDGKLTRKEFDAAVTRARAKTQSSETRRPAAPAEGTAPQGPRRPDEPVRRDEPPRPGQPPLPGRPGVPPSGFGGPDLFRALDSDNDGKLSKEELAKAVDALMRYDKNHDGSLTPEELAEGIRGSLPPGGPRPPGFPPPGEAPGRFLEAMIQRADKNGDGKLSKDEVPEMLRERFDDIDKNKDGFLDKEELAAVGERMRRLREEGGAPAGLPGRPGAGNPPGRPGGGAINEGNRERIAAYLREHDKDADGRVSAKEFGEERSEEFKKLDTNGDGYLTPDELARGISERRDRQESGGGRRPEEPSEAKKSEPDKQ